MAVDFVLPTLLIVTALRCKGNDLVGIVVAYIDYTKFPFFKDSITHRQSDAAGSSEYDLKGLEMTFGISGSYYP